MVQDDCDHRAVAEAKWGEVAKPEKKYRLLYDLKLMRPGCPLLQAFAGGTVDGFTLQCIGDWLVSPTPDMKVYTVTKTELDQLVELKMGKELGDKLQVMRGRGT